MVLDTYYSWYYSQREIGFLYQLYQLYVFCYFFFCLYNVILRQVLSYFLCVEKVVSTSLRLYHVCLILIFKTYLFNISFIENMALKYYLNERSYLFPIQNKNLFCLTMSYLFSYAIFFKRVKLYHNYYRPNLIINF